MKLKLTEEQLKQLIEMMESGEDINCDCGWSWDLSDGGNDPYICHKCGNDNEEK